MAGGRLITVDEAYEFFNQETHFKNEREMGDYIELNIGLFCDEVFEDEYVSHKREYVFDGGFKARRGSVVKKGSHNTRIDFLIICKNKNYAVEIKNPSQVRSEMVAAVSQMMNYQYEMEERKIEAEPVLVTSKYSARFHQLCDRFGLSYRYILFNKDRSAEWKR